jgi:hypothetical protein
MTSPYPRLIEIHRSRGPATGTPNVGLVGYSGREGTTVASDPESEQVLLTNVPAAIDAKAPGRTKGMYVPADIIEKPGWLILIPASAVPQYFIKDRDIVVDDEGYRYGVGSAWYTIAGYELWCVRLEV